jgi:IclR family transcriptional regulator, acetate operon repressor
MTKLKPNTSKEQTSPMNKRIAAQEAEGEKQAKPPADQTDGIDELALEVDGSVEGSVDGQPRSVSTIERATQVLFHFVETASPTLGVTEIANELGISKAVVHRILTSFCERDLVVSDPESRRYSLGPAVLLLASAFRERLDIRSVAYASLQQLCVSTNETATLSIRHGWQRVYVDQVTPNREVKMTVPIGRQFPLHAGSSSKAFLAFLPEQEREEYLEEAALTAITSATITDRIALRAELDLVRRQGYAISLGERQAGAGSAAAPVFDSDGPAAVLSLCGPLERFRDNLSDHVELLLQTTRMLSARLGHRGESTITPNDK